MDSNLTINSELLSTTHDRERRAERQIDKITLLEARRYGMAEKQSKGRIKYTYAGYVFIYDPKRNKAITSYKIDPNRQYPNQENERKKKTKEPKSGTRFFKPIIVQKSSDHDTVSFHISHEKVKDEVQSQEEKWTSHTIMVVDMSGSMREDDIDGARCRSDGVWTTLARDFVKQQLENETCSVFDVVSVVIMQATARVVLRCEPMTYVLYNKLVGFRDWNIIKPRGHGCYKPALEQVEELLRCNDNGACSLTVMFFSDGKPSDFHKENECFSWHGYNKANDELVELTGRFASRFGRRLNIICIGMAGQEESFDTLEKMTKEAEMYGAQTSFNRPDLNAQSLSEIVNNSVASSLASKTELTSLKTGKSRSVRSDVERERWNAPEDIKLNENWRVFRASDKDQYVKKIWIWNEKSYDFVRLIDPRCHFCYKEVKISSGKDLNKSGIICESCLVCSFCHRCNVVGRYGTHEGSEKCQELAASRRAGFLIGGQKMSFLHYNVAWKKKAFGEGAERLAFKFRFLGKEDTFIGPVMVAKESRFVEDLHDGSQEYLSSHRYKYHKTFMRTQTAAQRFAKIFNNDIDEKDEIQVGCAPKIRFLTPYIFELESTESSYNVLVEPLIEGKYKKFSDNFAKQAEEKKDFIAENHGVDLASAAMLLGRKYDPTTGGDKANFAAQTGITGGLGIIAEDGEEEEDSETEDEEKSVGSFRYKKFDLTHVKDEDYLQAFSHFTYVRSGGRRVVVDLQGTMQYKEGQKLFLLTDPAIHYRHQRHTKESHIYGRTDLGRRGMRAFFESHKCNEICRLLEFREKTSPAQLDRIYKQKVTIDPFSL